MSNRPDLPPSRGLSRLERERTECHRCGVVCEWVVRPAHCLRSECRNVYAHEDGGRTFFGCIERIFCVELDLEPHLNRTRGDAYGALKAQRPPRAECNMVLEEAYSFKYSWKACSNPLFRQHPDEYAPEAVRLLVDGATDTRR